MSAGDKFEISFDEQSLQEQSSDQVLTSFVGDVVERGSAIPVPPSEPMLKSNTGFPAHKKRAVISRFKKRQLIEHDTQLSTDDDAQLTEKQQIDMENNERLAAMSTNEIEEARQELLGTLDPALLQKLLRRVDISSGSNEAKDLNEPFEQVHQKQAHPVMAEAVTENDEPVTIRKDPSSEPLVTQHENVHFPRPPQPPSLDPSSETFLEDLHSKYFPSLPAEPDKLEWMRSPEDNKGYDPTSSTFSPRDIRFDFTGALIAPDTASQIAVSEGLHHHADAPGAAGYTIPELAHLSRSIYAPQRCIAFQTLGRILYKLGKGEFGDAGEPGANAPGAEDTVGELARGLWREMELERVIDHLVAESEGNGVDGGRHLSAKAYATEAIWLWRKGGGRRWKAD